MNLLFLSFQNDNLYVSTVNFRLQEIECFDELKAPPTGDLHVNLPPNGVCSYGNGACPVGDDYNEDLCTPGLPSSENFPLLSGHRLDSNLTNDAHQGSSKMLTVDCGEQKALLDSHPYHDVGYNQTGSPLSVASGGSYWTTGGDENESVSYHRMSPKGLALCEADDQWVRNGRTNSVGATGEPSSPNSDISSHHSGGRDGTGAAAQNDGGSSLDLPSPTSPTSPVALYSMQASFAASFPQEDQDPYNESSEEEEGNNISSYVQQTQASSMGLLVSVPQRDLPVEIPNSRDKKTETPCHHHSIDGAGGQSSKDREDDRRESIDSNDSDAVESYVLTGANGVPQSPTCKTLPKSPFGNSQETGASPVNKTRGGCRTDTDRSRPTLPVRSSSGGALDHIPMYTPHFPPDEDSDSMISMEDADLQYVQAGRLSASSRETTPPSSPMSNPDYSQSALLPGVAIDFAADESGVDTPDDKPTVDSIRHETNPSSDYDTDDDDAIDGYCTQGQFDIVPNNATKSRSGSLPMLPYVAIDIANAETSDKKTQASDQDRVTTSVPEPRSPARHGFSPPVCASNPSDSTGYVPQDHVMGPMMTKEGSLPREEENPRETTPPTLEKKSSYDNPEYGVLASIMDSCNTSQDKSLPDECNGRNDRPTQCPVKKQHSREDISTNNNSVYLPHDKVAMLHASAPSQGSDYLPHGKIPTSATIPTEKAKTPDQIVNDSGTSYVPHAQCLPEVKGKVIEVKGHTGYIPI